MKITTVIPAYKSKYLLELLGALAQQTEPADEVIFSDDSPDQSFTAMLANEQLRDIVRKLNITVLPGPRRGAYANWSQCINAYGGKTELVHILCDDDIIYPQFYERHRWAHRHGTFSSTVSRRWTASEVGQPLLGGLNIPDEIANHPQRLVPLDSGVVFATTVGWSRNWFGEVSNSVMRAETANLIVQRGVGGISMAGLEDLGALTVGSIANPLCFINEHLGFFRQSPNQNSANGNSAVMKCAIMSYLGLALTGHRLGQLSREQMLATIGTVGANVLLHYASQPDTAEIRARLPALMAGEPGSEEPFLAAWRDFVTAHGHY